MRCLWLADNFVEHGRRGPRDRGGHGEHRAFRQNGTRSTLGCTAREPLVASSPSAANTIIVDMQFASSKLPTAPYFSAPPRPLAPRFFSFRTFPSFLPSPSPPPVSLAFPGVGERCVSGIKSFAFQTSGATPWVVFASASVAFLYVGRRFDPGSRRWPDSPESLMRNSRDDGRL